MNPCVLPGRRHALATLSRLALLAALGRAGAGAAQTATPTAPPTAVAPTALRIALAPFLSPAALLAAFRPQREHLERALQRPVEMVTAKDFQALAEAARRGEHDVVQLPAHLARLAMVDWGYAMVAAPVEQVTVQVLVKAGGPVSTPDDLRGRRVGMLDALSLTATVGRSWLEREGLAAEVTVLTLPSINSALFALDRGEVGAVVAASSQLATLPPATPRGETPLAIIGGIPAPAYVARPGLPAADVAALQAAMERFIPDPSRPTNASNALLRPLDAAQLAALDPFVAIARQALQGLQQRR